MDMDQDKIAAGVRLILEGIGEDPTREGLRETPARVARAFAEVCGGLGQDPAAQMSATFDAQYHDIVCVRDIEFHSLCEHHLLPFFGVAHVAYLPGEDGRVCGLSKLARVVDVAARRPQLQERLTSQIADAIERALNPAGILVVVEAEHLCMTMRGVHKPGARTLTSVARGVFKDDAEQYRRAMELARPSALRAAD